MCDVSQTEIPRPPRPPRTVAGMVGALIVVVGLVVAVVAIRSAGQEPTPVKTADWQAWANAGRADGQLAVLAPPALPTGWVATSATYRSGTSPEWRIGMLTASRKFVGLEESLESTEDLVEEYVDEDAERGDDVTVAGEAWETWTDAHGDYALVRTLAAPTGGQERILVYGSAPDAAIRDFAGTLSTDVLPAS
jgi:hypothetical protein